MKHNNKEKKTAPKWKYNQLITLASLNVRGMRETTKREQLITHMMEHKIDILCLRETKMPGSNVERQDTHSFIFQSDIQANEEHHGAGFCFNRKMGKYRNHYIQHSSHLIDMEIINHGNNLVILGVYILHDLVHEPTRTNIWKKLSRKISELSTNRNVIVLGGFNASLRARKADEEQYIGNNILRKKITIPL